MEKENDFQCEINWNQLLIYHYQIRRKVFQNQLLFCKLVFFDVDQKS